MARRTLVAAMSVAVPCILATSALGATSPVCDLSGSTALEKDGMLTLGTDNPAYGPWFGGGEKTPPWKINDPSTGKGYESAVAYQVARRIGFARTEVQWQVTPFLRSFAPGNKPFDLFINQVSYTPARAKNVAFSVSYYNVAQAVVARRSNAASRARSVAALRGFTLGAQVGTTSLDAINNRIRPTKDPLVFDSNDAAVAALKAGSIDAIVVDLPTAYYVTAVQVSDGRIVGQLPAQGSKERFGMLGEKGGTLMPCVNKALNQMRSDGTLKALERKWLAGATAPFLR